MTRFTFSEEQIRSAPPAVRQWLESGVMASVAGSDEPGPYRRLPSNQSLAACPVAEAEHILGLVGHDTLAGRVFLAIGDERAEPMGASLYAVGIGAIVRRSRPSDGDELIDALYALSEAFQSVRDDAGATLFGFDQSTHVYVHETTYRSIRVLRRRLAIARSTVLDVSRYLGAGGTGMSSHDVIALPPTALLSMPLVDRSPGAMA